MQQQHPRSVLEVGSGPRFLAEYIFQHYLVPQYSNTHINFSYTAFDFSQAMHQLLKQKIPLNLQHHLRCECGDFKTHDWTQPLTHYDLIICHQALHELRHKRHAAQFHQQIFNCLHAKGLYLLCDHVYAPDGMQNNQLYMSASEMKTSLMSIGFQQIHLAWQHQGMCFFVCEK